MTADEFWAIVTNAGADAGTDRSAEALQRLLEQCSNEELIEFERHFRTFKARAYRWDLWGAAYAIDGGCSDDAFMDFRNALIMTGREIYERALAAPDSLAEVDIVGDESVGYIARRVYERRTGRDLPDLEIDYPQNPLGERWDFDDEAEVARRLPRIFSRSGASSSE